MGELQLVLFFWYGLSPQTSPRYAYSSVSNFGFINFCTHFRIINFHAQFRVLKFYAQFWVLRTFFSLFDLLRWLINDGIRVVLRRFPRSTLSRRQGPIFLSFTTRRIYATSVSPFAMTAFNRIIISILFCKILYAGICAVNEKSPVNRKSPEYASFLISNCGDVFLAILSLVCASDRVAANWSRVGRQ